MKSTKKSLVASGLSLLCCAALLVGTTFAWFTDSVVNKGNKIQAGTLDVSLAEWDGTAGGYVEVGEEPIFNYDLWEPGYTDIAAVKIGNDGTLALKYQLDIVATGATDLAEVIDVYYYQGGVVTTGTDLPKDFEALKADGNYVNMGTLAALLADEEGDGVAKGHLEAGMADFAIIALHMQETAGNEYQGASVGGTFDIVLNATQYTFEEDGFGSSEYDAGALYAKQENLNKLVAQGYTAVDSVSALKSALTEATDNEIKVVLAENISVLDLTSDNVINIQAGKDVTLDLNGSTIYAKQTTNTGVYGFINVLHDSALVLNDSTGNGNISFEYDGGNASYAGKATIVCEGTMIMNGGTIEFEGNGHEILGFGVDVKSNAWGTDYAAQASFTMNGGSIICDENTEAIRLVNSGSSDLGAAAGTPVKCVINDGTVYGWDAIFMQQINNNFKPFELEINGGNLTGVNYAVRIYNSYSNWTINENFLGNDVHKVTINGGTLTDGGNELPVVNGVAIRTVNKTLAEFNKFMKTVSISSVIEKKENIPN